MNNQYFDDNTSLPKNRKDHSFRFSCRSYEFVTDDGVFSKEHVDPGSELLLENAIKLPLHGDLLDLGCGYGVIGTVLKTTFPDCSVTCTDVNPRALELAEINTAKNNVVVKIVQSDGFENLSSNFDAIITNPPIRVGKKILYRLFEESYEHLNRDGIFLAVIRKQQGAASAQRKLETLYGNCSVIDRDKGYWILYSTRKD